jgi:hypothetical protein
MNQVKTGKATAQHATYSPRRGIFAVNIGTSESRQTISVVLMRQRWSVG